MNNYEETISTTLSLVSAYSSLREQFMENERTNFNKIKKIDIESFKLNRRILGWIVKLLLRKDIKSKRFK